MNTMPGLLDPITVGELQFPNRILMAPLTRNRSSAEARAPNALMRDYYVQRASAGAILSDGGCLGPRARGRAPRAPR
jgi:2,4-dienoyl-CoA reductase-like NADH-dependent reductase (Old Yellow Enzyme family)